MYIKIVKNKYINTLFLLMLFSAIVHMSILIVSALFNRDINVLNYFSILDIDFLLPNVLGNRLSNIISFITMLILYVLIFIFNKSHDEKG